MDLRKMPDKIFANKLPSNPDTAEIDRIIMEEASRAGIFEQINTDSDWKSVKKRIKKVSFKHSDFPLHLYFVRIAALVIFTTGLSYGFYKFLILNKNTDTGITTYAADRDKKEIILPDGSTVTLHAGSDLTLRKGFGSGSRDVNLNGEAFFKVIPGQDSPFRVFSGESVVKVTGTSFSVYQEDGIVHVSVLTGKVVLSSARNAEKSIVIAANQSGSLTEKNEVNIEEGVPENLLSWKTGHLIFDQMSIDSALMDIARHFERDLYLQTNIHEKITAEFQDQPLSEILDELTLVAGLKFDTTGTALVVRK
jgi:ferric-dicitrate binding protein FerR (iron transport regulator)